MKPFEAEKRVLPDFGRTHHLPWRANGSDDDSVAREEYAGMIFHGELTVEEKIDGACVGIRHTGDEPILRNREHILRKGYIKDTPSKMQFRPLWGWYYDHRESFEKLNALLGIEASVYGEWLYAKHTLYYDRLPSLFVAHSIWDPADGSFVPQGRARDALTGKTQPPEVVAKRAKVIREMWASCGDELSKKISLATTGKVRSDAVRAQMSDARKGIPMKESTRQKKLGTKASPETREKMRLAQTGKTKSPESIEKSRLARTGLKRSEETKEKMRQAHVLRKAATQDPSVE